MVERGQYGPPATLDIDAKVAEVAGRMRTPGGNRYERRTHDGRLIEYIFRELDDGGLLGVYHDITELRHREAALAAAKEAAGGRARRGGSRDPGQVDLPRHHEP